MDLMAYTPLTETTIEKEEKRKIAKVKSMTIYMCYYMEQSEPILL